MAHYAITIDDGTREFPICNTFGKHIGTVYFRPADISILDRYKTVIDRLPNDLTELSQISITNDGQAAESEGWATLKRVEKKLKDEINFLFDTDSADSLFETRNPFSSIGGEFYITRVLDALGGVIKEAVEEEAKLSNERLNKYLDDLPEADHAGTAAANA